MSLVKINPDVFLDYHYLRSLGVNPVCHGNGFIQLPHGKAWKRIHFWGHPDIPRQRVETMIHDHSYSLSSTVLKGEIRNIDYASSPVNPNFMVWSPKAGCKNSRLAPTGDMLSAHVAQDRRILTGEHYEVPAVSFHQTVTDTPTVTVMTRGPRRIGVQPRVLVPRRVDPDHKFYESPPKTDLLWWIIKDILKA